MSQETKTAKVLKRVDRGDFGPAAVYELDPPLVEEMFDLDLGEFVEKTIKYIWVSQSNNELLMAVQGCGETYAFRSDKNCTMDAYQIELSWSRKGNDIHPDELCEENGYTVVEDA